MTCLDGGEHIVADTLSQNLKPNQTRGKLR